MTNQQFHSIFKLFFITEKSFIKSLTQGSLLKMTPTPQHLSAKGYTHKPAGDCGQKWL